VLGALQLEDEDVLFGAEPMLVLVAAAGEYAP
jgi:hypothetical protein